MGPKTEEYLKKRREQKKLSMRRAREKLKQDPVKHEEVKAADRQRYSKDKELGKKKSIQEMSTRDQRAMRKKWRKNTSDYRKKKKIQEKTLEMLEKDTPPSSPNGTIEERPVPTSRSDTEERSKQNRRKYREAKNKEIKNLELKLKKLYAEKYKYKNKYYRLKKKQMTEDEKRTHTPRSSIRRMAKRNNMSDKVQRSLLFSAAVSQQIRSNFSQENSRAKKKLFSEVIGGHIIEKYKFKKYMEALTSQRCYLKTAKNRNIRNGLDEMKKEVQKFLEQDICSRMAPGKKDCITRKKVKKQKRLLNDTLKNLHEKFMKDKPTYQHMSYTMFCRLRPFWIVFPKVSQRDTTMCKKHTNMNLLVSKCSSLKMIKEKCVEELLSSDGVIFESYDENDSVSYEQWKTVVEIIKVKGIEKRCQKSVKVEMTSTKEGLKKEFQSQIGPFREHCDNISNQFKVISDLKNDLKEDEIILHFDFSENYNCKYSEEIQSAHFGGSKKQISLHTSVAYYYNGNGTSSVKSFCTFSENLRHDPSAICAHLHPVIVDLKDMVKNVKTVHFLSDGPVTQYRNRKMFQLWVLYLAVELGATEMTWNFSEAGHGKGAPDGVGGSVKRLADRYVARGYDVPNLDKLISLLKESNSKTNFHVIENEEIQKMDSLITTPIPAFKGTLSIHQLTWNKEEPSIIQVRRLSCLTCNTLNECEHFGIGQIKVINSPIGILYYYLQYSNEVIIVLLSVLLFKLNFYCCSRYSFNI